MRAQRRVLLARLSLKRADATARRRDTLVERNQPLMLVARSLMRKLAAGGLGLRLLRSLVECDRRVALTQGLIEIGLHLHNRARIGEIVAFAQFRRQGGAIRFQRRERRAHLVQLMARRADVLRRRFPRSAGLRLSGLGLFQCELGRDAFQYALAAFSAEHLADLGFDHAAEQGVRLLARPRRVERLALAHPQQAEGGRLEGARAGRKIEERPDRLVGRAAIGDQAVSL